MLHPRTLEFESKRDYSFEGCFDDVKHILKNADYVIGNLETSFAGHLKPAKKLSGIFNAPDNFLNVLKSIGITHLGNYNNHSLDFGLDGFQRTKSLIEKSNIIYLNKNYSDDIINVLTFSTHINNFTDKKKIVPENIIKEIKDIEPLIIKNDKVNIAFPHWGGQYLKEPSAEQVILSNKLICEGYQLIIGNGNHLPLETIKRKNKIIAHCLGDFFSAHDKKGSTDLGKILKVRINNGKSSIKEYFTRTLTNTRGFSKIEIIDELNTI